MTALGYDKIKGLVYTEKSNKQLSDNKYQFEVDASCTKDEVASIIKNVFSVEVKKINIINVKPKTRRFKNVEGKTKSFKKVIVTLKEGQSINFGS